MVVISHKAIREYALKYPAHKEALERWYQIAEQANWGSFSEIKTSFNSVDAVGNGLFVFNIKGNDCRLVARILFKARTVFIRFVGTHSEYDRLNISTL
ncbi:MAG: addiction module toxin RelE [Sphingobacteriales bacterium 41-5]|nr:MAG: addiction module toxin RelE [Sphingobacteriales bacterium 41-5]